MRRTRILLLVTTVVLVAVGVVMIYSASAVYAYEKYGDSGYFFKKHLVFLAIGILLALVAMVLDYRILQKNSKAILFISWVFLVLVLIPGLGKQVAGARRWFSLFGLRFQPSEFVKLTFMIYLADYLSRKSKHIKDLFIGVLPASAIMGFTVLLILIQPDLGTAVAIGCIGFIMFFASGIRLWYLGAAFLAALPALYILIFSVPYRRNRILAFLNPWQDPRGVGFQIIQSFLAIGSGGLLGVGLGKSTQKLFYLPAAHTDFIFSIISEELGLIGAGFVVCLFMLFVWYGCKIIFRAIDDFGKLLALGIVSMIALEAIVNIGVSTGAFPTKGLPLPFISYGGSSVVVHLIAVGLLLNIGRTAEEKV